MLKSIEKFSSFWCHKCVHMLSRGSKRSKEASENIWRQFGNITKNRLRSGSGAPELWAALLTTRRSEDIAANVNFSWKNLSEDGILRMLDFAILSCFWLSEVL